jgi:hypothetical protein
LIATDRRHRQASRFGDGADPIDLGSNGAMKRDFARGIKRE